MKNKIFLIAVLFILFLTAGCNKEKTASEQIDQIKTETKDAAQKMQDYTYAQKDQFVQEMQDQLAALNKDLDALSVKIENSSDAVKAEARPKLQALRDQAAQLSKQLEDVKNSSENTWDQVKASSKQAYDSLSNGLNEARQWLSEKIAP